MLRNDVNNNNNNNDDNDDDDDNNERNDVKCRFDDNLIDDITYHILCMKTQVWRIQFSVM